MMKEKKVETRKRNRFKIDVEMKNVKNVKKRLKKRQ